MDVFLSCLRQGVSAGMCAFVCVSCCVASINVFVCPWSSRVELHLSMCLFQRFWLCLRLSNLAPFAMFLCFGWLFANRINCQCACLPLGVRTFLNLVANWFLEFGNPIESEIRCCVCLFSK